MLQKPSFPIRKKLLDSWSDITFQICGKSQPGNRTINLSQFSVLFCNFLILIIVYFCGWKWIVFCTGYFFYMLKNKCVSFQILSEEILFGTKHNFYGYSCRTSAFLEENFFTRSASWMWIHIQKFAHHRCGKWKGFVSKQNVLKAKPFVCDCWYGVSFQIWGLQARILQWFCRLISDDCFSTAPPPHWLPHFSNGTKNGHSKWWNLLWLWGYGEKEVVLRSLSLLFLLPNSWNKVYRL